MENTSYRNNSTFIFRDNIWKINLIFSAVLAFLSIYVLAAFLFYIAKKRKQKENFFQLSLEKKYRFLSLCLSCFIGFFAVVRHLNSIALLWFEKQALQSSLDQEDLLVAERRCEILPRIGVSFLTSGLTFVYLFLWFRQRIFYIHPSLSVLNSKVVSGLSSFSFALWLGYFIATTLSYFFIVRYHFEPFGGCLIVKETGQQYADIITSWAVFSVFMQMMLLGLFIYPIVKRGLWKDHSENLNPCLFKRVQKAVLLTSACLFSDIVSAIASNTLYTADTNNVFIVYSVNLLVNHLVTIACFDYWKLILWPWCIKTDSIDINKESKSPSTTII